MGINKKEGRATIALSAQITYDTEKVFVELDATDVMLLGLDWSGVDSPPRFTSELVDIQIQKRTEEPCES